MQLMSVFCIGQFGAMPRQQADRTIERPASRQADSGSADQNTATISINHAPFLLIYTESYTFLIQHPIPFY
jgi:hypothetical protein